MKNELLKMIDSNEIISFDIFDTLILRNVLNPIDIFKILDEFASSTYDIHDFYNIRIDSEKKSRIKSNNYECNIDEIYNCVAKIIKNKKTVNKLKEKELSLELEFCVRNPFMHDIFNCCLKKNKKVILISDMYLKKDFINQILTKAGYKNYELYVSNDYNKNKGTKELFKKVYEINGFSKEKWLHIGDNHLSDYRAPLDFGINAYNYKSVTSYNSMVPETIFESIILAIQCNYLYNGSEIDYWDKFGVKYVSPIYFGVTKWLYDLTSDKDNLFFLARDGYMIEKVYKLFDKKGNVFTKYLYCSRESIQIPSMIQDSDDDLIKLLTETGGFELDLTLEEFIKNSKLNIKSIKKSYLSAYGFNDLSDLITEKNYYNARKLVSIFKEQIKQNLASSRKIAIDFLNKQGLNNFDKINIFDVGWSGSLQSSISSLVNKKVTGYYFGTINKKGKNSFTEMFGYYFDLDYPEENKKIIMDNVMMYELIFSAPHGTTIGYKKEGDGVVPMFNDNTNNSKFIEQFQKSALNIIKKYLKYINFFDGVHKNFCVDPYNSFIKQKKYEDLCMFSKVNNDVLSNCNKKISYVKQIDPVVLENSEDLKKSIHNIKNCLWKDAYIITDKTSHYCYQDYIDNLIKYEIYDEKHECAKMLVDYGDYIDQIYVPYNIIGNYYSFKFNFLKPVKALKIIVISNKKIKIKNLIINTNKGNAKCSIPNKRKIISKLRQVIDINSLKPTIILKSPNYIKKIEFYATILKEEI